MDYRVLKLKKRKKIELARIKIKHKNDINNIKKSCIENTNAAITLYVNGFIAKIAVLKGHDEAMKIANEVHKEIQEGIKKLCN